MKRAVVVSPPGPITAGQWLRHFAGAEVIAVCSEDDEHLLGALVAQLGSGLLICATRPVGEALKVVVEGVVIEAIDRDQVLEPTLPFAFTVALARAVLKEFDVDATVDLLAALASRVTPLQFRRDFSAT